MLKIKGKFSIYYNQRVTCFNMLKIKGKFSISKINADLMGMS